MKFIELSHFGRHKGKKTRIPSATPFATASCFAYTGLHPRCQIRCTSKQWRRVRARKESSFCQKHRLSRFHKCVRVCRFKAIYRWMCHKKKDRFWVRRSTKSCEKVSNQTDASSNLARQRGESVKIKKSVLLQTFVLFSSNF